MGKFTCTPYLNKRNTEYSVHIPQRKVQRFRERARNWHVVSKASSASCPWIWLIEGQCRNHTLPQAALFTETLGHSKTECRASLQLRNCRLHRPRK